MSRVTTFLFFWVLLSCLRPSSPLQRLPPIFPDPDHGRMVLPSSRFSMIFVDGETRSRSRFGLVEEEEPAPYVLRDSRSVRGRSGRLTLAPAGISYCGARGHQWGQAVGPAPKFSVAGPRAVQQGLAPCSSGLASCSRGLTSRSRGPAPLK